MDYNTYMFPVSEMIISFVLQKGKTAVLHTKHAQHCLHLDNDGISSLFFLLMASKECVSY